MEAYNFFLNKEGHLRSGWRLAGFAVAFLVCLQLCGVFMAWGLGAVWSKPSTEPALSYWNFAVGHGSILIAATLVGWGCGAVFEQLPFRALGCSPQTGWLKHFGIGTAIGAASLLFAGLLVALTRGVHFQIDKAGVSAIGKTLAVSAVVFIFAGTAEEMLFRGYPLQTLTRANLVWLGVLLTSVPFALVHLSNPHVVPFFTFINTALAGVWLAAAYLRTRSLWLPFGIHWSWNWAQASLLGLPVSGIEQIAPAPVLHAMNTGPDWLTGGAYGIEGGAACTVALLISTAVIWRTKLIAPLSVPTRRAGGDSPPS
jgi:membrane protease YdiL (CAAX protease family)